MGLFDAVMAKANELAGDAERAGKVAAAQARLVALQNDVRKAERELGQAAYALIEQGELEHPSLSATTAALLEAHDALAEKEQEIAALRGEAAPASARGETFVTYPAASVAAPEAAATPADGPPRTAPTATEPEAPGAGPEAPEAETPGAATGDGEPGDDERSPADAVD